MSRCSEICLPSQSFRQHFLLQNRIETTVPFHRHAGTKVPLKGLKRWQWAYLLYEEVKGHLGGAVLHFERQVDGSDDVINE